MNTREELHQAKLMEWKERVGICRSSGLLVRRWCEEQGIKVKTYYY